MATASWQPPDAEDAAADEDLSEYSVVCSLSELQQLGRKKVIHKERVVVIFYVEGKVYALDHFCYRKTPTTLFHAIYLLMCSIDTGGPLELGDIEVLIVGYQVVT